MPDDSHISQGKPIVRIGQRDLEPSRRVSVKFLRCVVGTALDCAGYRRPCEIGLTLTVDSTIRALNADYRDKDEPTDVLSFALQEGMEMPLPPGLPIPLGDIVVSLDTTERQAQAGGLDPMAELGWVVCHGVLHLLGYDHDTEAQRIPMRELEILVLERLGLAKPVLV